MQHIVMFSGGIGSWAAAKRVAAEHGTDNLTLLFSDTGIEDEDLYRFIDDAHANIGGELVILRDGRDVWQVFRDKRFIGNSRLASCSHELKQKPARSWLESNYTHEQAIVYVGIDWSEIHRLGAIERNYAPYIARAPLTEKPYMDKQQLIDWAESEGLTAPRLYGLGFAHNNCGGFCVRAGQAQFKKLLEVFPDRYAAHEKKEQEMRDYLAKDVSILTETKKGVKAPLTLKTLRERVEAQQPIDANDWGGCGCFVEDDTPSTHDPRSES
jgi:hypothetical protein